MRLRGRLLNDDEEDKDKLEKNSMGQYITNNIDDVLKLPKTSKDVYKEDFEWMTNWIRSRRNVQENLYTEDRNNRLENHPIKLAYNNFLNDAFLTDRYNANKRISESLNRIDNVSVRDDKYRSQYPELKWLGYYHHKPNSVYVRSWGLDNNNQSDIMTHELAHASGLQQDGATRRKIWEVLSNSETYQNYESPNPNGPNVDYYKSINEVHSRIFQLRKLLNLSPSDIVTPDMLKLDENHSKIRNLRWMKDSIPLNDEEISKLMNEIVFNDSNKQQSNFG